MYIKMCVCIYKYTHRYTQLNVLKVCTEPEGAGGMGLFRACPGLNPMHPSSLAPIPGSLQPATLVTEAMHCPSMLPLGWSDLFLFEARALP